MPTENKHGYCPKHPETPLVRVRMSKFVKLTKIVCATCIRDGDREAQARLAKRDRK